MRILIVDDSPFINQVCKQALEKEGHEVVGFAFDGIEAVEKAIETSPDMVLLDVALPKKNGFEAAKMIHENRPKTKILAISAIEEEWLKNQLESSFVHAFLEKPFDVSELIEKVNALDQQQGFKKHG